MTAIHDLPDWPAFAGDFAALAEPLGALRHRQGRHVGRLEALAPDLRRRVDRASRTQEVVSSAALSGQALEPEEVAAALRRGLAGEGPDRARPPAACDGHVAVALDAAHDAEAPLTAERLGAWHAALVRGGGDGLRPVTVGTWRGRRVGPRQAAPRPALLGRAPPARRLEGEMRAFLAWFNAPPQHDPVLQAGIALLWFLAIQPFDGGNGRIARALTDLVLARGDGTDGRSYSLSAALLDGRDAYAARLDEALGGTLDITPWLLWFLGCLDRAIEQAAGTVAPVLAEARLRQRLDGSRVGARQRRVIARMLAHPEECLSTSRYAALAACSTDTALRDVHALLERGVLVRNPAGGRSTSYRLGAP